MEICDQVCSFEQAKIFVTLGLNLETLHHWREPKQDSASRGVEPRIFLFDKYYPGSDWENQYPAYTVAELGFLLENYHVRYRYGENVWEITRESEISQDYNKRIHAFLNINQRHENLARASALIWILENGYLKVVDLKL